MGNTTDLASDGDVVRLPISALVVAGSPRLAGENLDHVQLLTETEADLPPIIVHRTTLRVIDGVHRVLAATLRGEQFIAAQYFDGPEADAFVLAVRRNISHGLPLTLADRKAAAARIVRTHTQWSDRAIASATGLSPKTVGALRPAAPSDSPETRIGRDGRRRLVNNAEARRLAADYLTRHPKASLADVAKATGVSVRTAGDIRDRLNRGLDPTARPLSVVPRQTSLTDAVTILRNLRDDPSLRLSESSRMLIRLLDAHVTWSRDSRNVVDHLPTHSIGMIVSVALACADNWREFAERLEARERDQMSSA